MKTSVWHKEILPFASREVLSDLLRTMRLSQFYLAGGTGLALLLGHRLSRDFDFFSAKLFNEDSLIQCMQGLHDLTIVAKSEHTVHITLKGLKVSFLGYSYPLLFPMKQYRPAEGISIDVADEIDIACMKISAISSRGTRRDFVDLYKVARSTRCWNCMDCFKRSSVSHHIIMFIFLNRSRTLQMRNQNLCRIN